MRLEVQIRLMVPAKREITVEQRARHSPRKCRIFLNGPRKISTPEQRAAKPRTITQAETHRSATQMFEGYPHLTVFPGTGWR